jgi:allophanate hydrolase
LTEIQSLDLIALARGYAARAFTPVDVARDVLRRIAAAGDDHVWIRRVADAELLARAQQLAGLDDVERTRLPLYGVPFAVKDNIDVAGLPTTAACPAYAYTPERDATCVAKLLAAGAMCVGKTNLDQFATGLVGVRSPYGTPRNPFNDKYIPGGSSSGSAVAVAAGLVSFALGTDTAGSGRVPAGFNNIVGLKPTRGMISTAGVVPACRTLDCVSIFALTVPDATDVLDVVAGPDERDPFSRSCRAPAPRFSDKLTIAVPRADQRQFFGDAMAQAAFERELARLIECGGTMLEIDYAPFLETAKLLYEGPWVAERYLVARNLLERQPEALHPVTRKIISGGAAFAAADAFVSFYRLEELRSLTRKVWSQARMMAVPTSGTIYTLAQVQADPVRLNANLGYYTNFVNFLDLCALAVPGEFRPDGLPAGVTLIAPAWCEGQLVNFARFLHERAGATTGATGAPLPKRAGFGVALPSGHVALAVFGAHLTDQPLSSQLTALGAMLVRPCRTAATYRLYALSGNPPRPGLVRVATGGAAIEGEVWVVPASRLGEFVAGIPAPLGIGKVLLDDGSTVSGFICEPIGIAGARDITAFGGWRAYLNA